MIVTPAVLETFLSRTGDCVRVTVERATGSVPREEGAWMLVGKDALLGTIGGGQLEFMAIDRARAMIGAGERQDRTSVPLGPRIGQCCGGHVTLAFELIDETTRPQLAERVKQERASRPHVYVFGAGHVGRALAASLSLLPVRTRLVETRAETLHGLPEAIETELTPLPEQIVDEAPPASAFIVLTHQHALDFLIVGAALQRRDAAYVGMIGSKTKRATFESQFRREGGDAALLSNLVCPIGMGRTGMSPGGSGPSDKRPEIIAAMATAEILGSLLAPGP